MNSTNSTFWVVASVELCFQKIILSLIHINNTGTEEDTKTADARLFVEKELVGADGIAFVSHMFDG